MRSAKYYIIDNGKRVEINLDKEVAMNAYNDYVGRNIREFDLRVKFNGSKMLTSSDIASIRINSDLFTADSFTIGSVIAETLELTIYMDTVFGTDDFNYVDGWVIDKEKPIVPYVALKTEVEIETELGFVIKEVWQEVNLGPFFINPDGVNEDGLGIMSIRASTLFTHPTYSNRTLEFLSNRDRSISELIEKAEDAIKDDKVHFELLNTDIPNIMLKYDNIEDMSVREAINYAAILYGGYARTIYNESNDRVYLEFFRKEQTDYVYDESSYINLSRGGSGSGLNVSKIKCKINDENTMLSGSYTISRDSIISGSGSDTNSTVFIECPDMTEEQLYAILLQFKGYNFRPTTTKIFGNPLLQVGDITTVKGNGVNSSGDELPLHSVIYNITGSGLTMDIKSLFKITEAERKARAVEGSGGNDSGGSTDQNLNELYDRTTIQYEDKDKGLPLITIKDDYLETKEKLNKHISNSSLHSGIVGGDGNNSRLTFVDDDGNSVSSIGYQTVKTQEGEESDKISSWISENGRNIAIGMTDGDDGNSVNLPIVLCNEEIKYNEYRCYKGLNIDNPIIRNNMYFGRPSYNNKITTAQNQIYLNLFGKAGFVFTINDTYGSYSSHNVMFMQWTSMGSTDGSSLSYYTVYIDAHLAVFGQVIGAQLSNCQLSSDLDAQGCEITNLGDITKTVSSQSEYTTNLINGGTNENIMHSNLSYDSGELRWCWKENVFTYAESEIDPETDQWVYTGRYICYVELPIFMAENIQNDYHINVSKMSWGDYRIIEKNPYYFILESQEDNFAFTFEVVAKLNDNQTLNNNAIIANSGFESWNQNGAQED